MICRNCGKECPNTKFCVFCGEPLIDPQQIFMGTQFDTVEECNVVKQDYKKITEKFTTPLSKYTLDDLEAAIEDCKHGKYHPAASTLALRTLEPNAQKMRKQAKEDRISAAGRWLTLLYAIVFTAIAFTMPLFKVANSNRTLWGMMELIVNSEIESYTWGWNLFLTIFLVSFIYALLSSVKENDSNLVGAPIAMAVLLVGLWLLNLVFGFMGLDYHCAFGFYMMIISGGVIGICNYIL